MKNLLLVVDERKMGGVSILLEDMIRLGVFEDYNTDILVLHNNGTMLNNLPSNINIIYGTKFFNAVDLTIKEAIKSKNVKLIFSKIKLVFLMKTGLIKNKIIKERKKILTKQYDIEIAFKDGFTALFTAFGNSTVKMHWLHYEYKECNPNAKYDKLFQTIMPKFNKFIAVSNGVKDAFTKIYDIKNIEVIPNFIDAKKIINKSKETAIIKWEKDKVNIILVGRIHQVKGYDRFLKVVSRLQKDGLGEKLNINIIGDGPEMENIVNLKKQLGVNINFWGKMDNPYKEIKNADLFILPSVYESFGLVVLEAMILHIPVLATKTAAITSLIDNDKNGLIVDNSEEGIYQGLKKIIQDKDILKKYKQNLNNYTYDASKIIDRIKEILKECYNAKVTK